MSKNPYDLGAVGQMRRSLNKPKHERLERQRDELIEALRDIGRRLNGLEAAHYYNSPLVWEVIRELESVAAAAIAAAAIAAAEEGA